MTPVKQLTTRRIRLEIDELKAQLSDFLAGQEGMSGSGEWMRERMDELDAELKLREG